jgi:uncharacterized protein (DUF1330 family)
VACSGPEEREIILAKAYWITAYRRIIDPEKLAAYAKLAGPAIAAAGGRFLARGTATKVFEAGVAERTVLIEFDSVEKATACYESDAYRKALAALGNGAERDIRIVPGVEP